MRERKGLPPANTHQLDQAKFRLAQWLSGQQFKFQKPKIQACEAVSENGRCTAQNDDLTKENDHQQADSLGPHLLPKPNRRSDRHDMS